MIVLVIFFVGLIGYSSKWKYLEGNVHINHKYLGCASDARINYIWDIINGIKTIKAYWWEKFFYDKVFEARKTQLNYVFKIYILFALAIMFSMSSGYLVSILLFGYQIGVGRELSYSTTMVSYTMMTYISFRNLLLFFSALNFFFRLLAIFKRADEILWLDEHSTETPTLEEHELEDIVIHINKLTASWGFQILKDIYTGDVDIKDNPTNNLVDISLDANKKDLIAIIGQVGSGKSTLLAAIMNELMVVSGEVKTRGKIWYVEQDPFIMSQTIKDNILFGEPYNEERFNSVIKACWLDRDIDIFDKGIETLIGERGINVSGGQKARISLARAAYSNSDIYLLDDPLSALDQKVGKEVYNKCICKFLANKWVILVTHQVQLLTNVKKIFILDNGKIVNEGTFEELNEFRYLLFLYSINFS